MVQVLSTLIGPRPRRARVAGHDLDREPDAVGGATGQFSASTTLLTGQHHLGRAAGRRRAAELLDRFALTDVASRPTAPTSALGVGDESLPV